MIRTCIIASLATMIASPVQARTPKFVQHDWGGYQIAAPTYHHRLHKRVYHTSTNKVVATKKVASEKKVTTRSPTGQLLSMVFTQAEIDAMARCERVIPSEVIAEARKYLADTASPGGTMSRQGVEWTMAQLHPVFAVRLARAIWQDHEHGGHTSVFSAYRKPGLGVGAFRNKFDSFHSYGLAVDLTGIGTAGSKAHGNWDVIARANGLVDPYKSAIEFNHYQLIPRTMVARSSPMRPLVSASRGPIDRLKMWVASGMSPDGIEPVRMTASANEMRVAIIRSKRRYNRRA